MNFDDYHVHCPDKLVWTKKKKKYYLTQVNDKKIEIILIFGERIVKYRHHFSKYFLKQGQNQCNFDFKLSTDSGKKLYRLIGGSMAKSFKMISKNTTDL